MPNNQLSHILEGVVPQSSNQLTLQLIQENIARTSASGFFGLARLLLIFRDLLSYRG